MTRTHILLTIEVGSSGESIDDEETLTCNVTYPAELTGGHKPITVEYLRPDITEGLHQGIARAAADIQLFMTNPKAWLSSSEPWRKWQETWRLRQEYRRKAEQMKHEQQYYQGMQESVEGALNYWAGQLLKEGKLAAAGAAETGQHPVPLVDIAAAGAAAPQDDNETELHEGDYVDILDEETLRPTGVLGLVSAVCGEGVYARIPGGGHPFYRFFQVQKVTPAPGDTVIVYDPATDRYVLVTLGPDGAPLLKQ